MALVLIILSFCYIFDGILNHVLLILKQCQKEISIIVDDT